MRNDFMKIATTSERLKVAMEIRQKRQADLAKITGIDKGAISHYLSGSYEPKDKAIHKLARALDVYEMWLWGYDVPMERLEEQKNSDAKIDIASRLYDDSLFFEAVKLLDKLNPEQLKKITELMELFDKESSYEI